MKFTIFIITIAFLLSCGQNHHITRNSSLSEGEASVALNNPGNVFLGKPTIFTGFCSSSTAGLDVTLTISGVTPAILTCPCSGGTFTCPETTYNNLPAILNFDVSYDGAVNKEMGYGSCPPYTPPTNSGKERYYRRQNIGNVNLSYSSSANFNSNDSFGLRTKGGGSNTIRNIAGSTYIMNDYYNNSNRELTYSGIMVNLPSCQNDVLFEAGDLLEVIFTTQGVGRYAVLFKQGLTPNSAPFVYGVNANSFASRQHIRSTSLVGDITSFYSRVYFVDLKDSAQMRVRYRINGGPILNIPNTWISDVSSDASLSIAGLVAPTALDDSVKGAVDAILDLDVLANDTDDVSIDPTQLLILQNANAGTEGTCSITSANFIRFTPVASFVGTASCVYKVCDNQEVCDTAKVDFTYE